MKKDIFEETLLSYGINAKVLSLKSDRSNGQIYRTYYIVKYNNIPLNVLGALDETAEFFYKTQHLNKTNFFIKDSIVYAEGSLDIMYKCIKNILAN